jgi:hypothetical protein
VNLRKDHYRDDDVLARSPRRRLVSHAHFVRTAQRRARKARRRSDVVALLHSCSAHVRCSNDTVVARFGVPGRRRLCAGGAADGVVVVSHRLCAIRRSPAARRRFKELADRCSTLYSGRSVAPYAHVFSSSYSLHYSRYKHCCRRRLRVGDDRVL